MIFETSRFVFNEALEDQTIFSQQPKPKPKPKKKERREDQPCCHEMTVLPIKWA